MKEDNEIIKLFEEFEYDLDRIIPYVEMLSELHVLSETDKLGIKAFVLNLCQFRIIEKYCTVQ